MRGKYVSAYNFEPGSRELEVPLGCLCNWEMADMAATKTAFIKTALRKGVGRKRGGESAGADRCSTCIKPAIPLSIR